MDEFLFYELMSPIWFQVSVPEKVPVKVSVKFRAYGREEEFTQSQTKGRLKLKHTNCTQVWRTRDVLALAHIGWRHCEVLFYMFLLFVCTNLSAVVVQLKGLSCLRCSEEEHQPRLWYSMLCLHIQNYFMYVHFFFCWWFLCNTQTSRGETSGEASEHGSFLNGSMRTEMMWIPLQPSPVDRHWPSAHQGKWENTAYCGSAVQRIHDNIRLNANDLSSLSPSENTVKLLCCSQNVTRQWSCHRNSTENKMHFAQFTFDPRAWPNLRRADH